MSVSTILAPVRRALAMSREELLFRARSEIGRRCEQTAFAARPPSWRRSALHRLLAPSAVGASPELKRAATAARAGDWGEAHESLASYFSSSERPAPFPLRSPTITALASRIRDRFPGAAAESTRRANRILDGHYDLLGYHDLSFGMPTDWHLDPVSGRRAPRGFWSSIKYLDAASGDHKVIWELNRHQHWLALGRAWALTGDRRYYREFVTQLENWLADNPPLAGVNWTSMLELGFRSISWIWALHLFAGAVDPGDASPWTIDLLVGVDRQLAHIERNLSRFFSPNTHLLGEALALYVAGASLPELRSSARWRSVGRELLLREATRQVLSDGGHAERSAHYHRYSTDFYLFGLLVARASGDRAAPRFEEALTRQAQFLRAIADDSGRLPLIGDDDGGQLFPICGREPWDCRDTLAAAAALLQRPELGLGEAPEEAYWLCGVDQRFTDVDAAVPRDWPSRAFFESGYFVCRTCRGDHLVFDAGPHGFLNGGHAHSDALSIVLTSERAPLLIDPGTAIYTMAPAVRDLFRSSAMHNTVVVDGVPQAMPDGPFHWRRTAASQPVVWRGERDFEYLEAFHDGYFPVVHTRVLIAAHDVGWFVVDRVLGEGSRTADAFWHVHPSWHLVPDGPLAVIAHHRGRATAIASSTLLRIFEGGEGPDLRSYAPVYGRIERGGCVIASACGALPLAWLTFVPAFGASAGEVEVEALTVCRQPGEEWHGVAFRVRVGEDEYVLLSAVERPSRPASADRAAAGRNTRGPGRDWGCRALRTDARMALARTSRARSLSFETIALVNGQKLESSPAMASSVHESPVAEASQAAG